MLRSARRDVILPYQSYPKMKSIGISAAAIVLLLAAPLRAQEPPRPLTQTPVRTQILSDSIFENVTTTVNHLEMAPGALLTNPHSHPGDLMGYIIEGSILTGLEHGELVRYDAGEMFYEPQGILHTHFQNASETEPARVLIVLITKAGS